MKPSTLRVPLLAVATWLAACGGDGGSSPSAPDAPSYAGVWEGQTSSSRAVRMVVNGTGGIDSLSVTVRLSIGLNACTGPLVLSAPASINGSSFSASLVFPGSNITSQVQGSFTSATAVNASYQGFSGSFSLICGNSFSVGTGSPLSSGTFQASKR